jgi:hypothetical protein
MSPLLYQLSYSAVPDKITERDPERQPRPLERITIEQHISMEPRCTSHGHEQITRRARPVRSALRMDRICAPYRSVRLRRRLRDLDRRATLRLPAGQRVGWQSRRHSDRR